jgi:GAF domain-containing protein
LAEELNIKPGATREQSYRELIPQIEALIAGEPDLIANLANIAAALRATFGFLWIGFYLVKGDELVLGPFQGPVACTRIPFGRGVCGTAWRDKATIVVPDVEQFPGHIACSPFSKSEIVVPVMKKGEVTLILDIDSDRPHDFSEIDDHHLQRLASLIETAME